MAIDGLTIKEGATYTPSGGTDITFVESGETVANGIVCINEDETDFYAREKLYATARPPVVGSDGEFTKQKVSFRILDPGALASGKMNYDLIRIEVEVHPENGNTTVDKLVNLGIAALNSSDLSNFFRYGSLK
jgi:hypothetical protein